MTSHAHTGPAVTSQTTHPPRARELGRSLTFERGLVLVIGLIVLAVGVLGFLASLGVFPGLRPGMSLLPQPVTAALRDYPQVVVPVVALLGVVLFLLGVWWVSASLRPESHPDLRVEPTDGPADDRAHWVATLTHGAFTDAIRADAQRIDGVARARVRTTGSWRDPGLRLTLGLQEGTDLRRVWEQLDDRVLDRAFHALGARLPTVIRVELDRTPSQRVR